MEKVRRRGLCDALPMLIAQLDCKLNLALPAGGRDDAEATQVRYIGAGRVPGWRVGEVKGFRAQLEVKALPNAEILEQRSV